MRSSLIILGTDIGTFDYWDGGYADLSCQYYNVTLNIAGKLFLPRFINGPHSTLYININSGNVYTYEGAEHDQCVVLTPDWSVFNK